MAFVYRDRFPGSLGPRKVETTVYRWVLDQTVEEESAGDFWSTDHAEYNMNAEHCVNEASSIKFDESKIYDSIDEGMAAQKGSRYAFRYYLDEKSRTEERLEDRIQREIQKLQCYADSHHVRTHKSKFTGCRYCGSKVNNEYVNDDNVCPCCGQSLYSDTDRATINRYKGNIDRWQQELEEMQRTNKRKKSGTMWYVSTLYH